MLAASGPEIPGPAPIRRFVHHPIEAWACRARRSEFRGWAASPRRSGCRSSSALVRKPGRAEIAVVAINLTIVWAPAHARITG
jgi:hypothetical protein